MFLGDKITNENPIDATVNDISPKFTCYTCYELLSVADPGFPRRGEPSLGRTARYDFAKFSPKLHEVERIWTPRFGGWGGRLKFYYINLPLPVVEQREWKENKNLSLSIQTNCNLAWQKKGIFYLLFCFFSKVRVEGETMVIC